MQNLRMPAFAAALLFAAALGGCETTGSPGPEAAAAPSPQPMTHQQAALECWMAQEKNTKVDLDKRADLVDKCIDQKMNGSAAPTSTAAAKPDAGPKTGAAKPKT
jgi:hypothetical protein